MKSRRFRQLDVFTAAPYRGNPLAVVLDGEGLADERMRQFARWTNLSETTFLLPPTVPSADYRVRIFTPGGELPFAGHPTLGSCHAWLAAGGRARGDTVVQQCAVGRVRVRREGDRLAFEAPPLQRSAAEPGLVAQVLAALGADASQLRAAQWLDNGPQWLGLLLDSAASVLALEPDHAALQSLAKVGVIGPCAPGGASAFEVRAFAAPIGIAEDPVTGSLNASLAQWLIAEGVAPPRYVAAQGARLERAGRVHVELREGQVWVGGSSVICVEGRVLL
jgi:PhzF family phenazine biosynthesis protein